MSPEGKKHVHEVVEFERCVFRSQIYNFFNDTAYCKALKKDEGDANGYDKEVAYLLKTSPDKGDIVAWPSVDCWMDFECVRDYFS